MKRKAAEGLAKGHRTSKAANEELANGRDRRRSGWNPYEVWRTRVKESSRVKPERKRDPLH